jgi:hypothetical protein
VIVPISGTSLVEGKTAWAMIVASASRFGPTSANNRVPLALATLAPVKHGPVAYWCVCRTDITGRWVLRNGRVVGPRRHPKNVIGHRWEQTGYESRNKRKESFPPEEVEARVSL